MQNKVKINDHSFSSEERDNEIVTLDYDTYQDKETLNEIVDYDHIENDPEFLEDENENKNLTMEEAIESHELNINNHSNTYHSEEQLDENNQNQFEEENINEYHDSNHDQENHDEEIPDLAEIGDENEQIKNTQISEPEFKKQISNDTKSNYEMKSEFNVELKTNQQFINMDHFDEASRAGFAINYISYDSNSNFYSKDDYQAHKSHEDYDQFSANQDSFKIGIFGRDKNYLQDSIGNKHNILLNSVENRINEQEEESDQIRLDEIQIREEKNESFKEEKHEEKNEIFKEEKHESFKEEKHENFFNNDILNEVKEVKDLNVIEETSSYKNKKKLFKENSDYKNSNGNNYQIKSVFKFSEQPYYDKNYKPVDYHNLTDRDMLSKFKLIENSELFKNFAYLNYPSHVNILKKEKIKPPVEKITNKLYLNSKSEKTTPMSKLNHKSNNRNIILKDQLEPNNFNLSSTNFRKTTTTFSDTYNKSPKSINKLPYPQNSPSYSYSLQDIDQKLKTKDDQIKSLQEELRYLTANYDKTVKSLEILEIKFVQRERENKELTEKVNILQTDYEESQERINELLTHKIKIQSDFSEKSSQFEKLLLEKEELENKMNKYFDENSTLKNQIDVMKVEIKMQQNELIKKNDKITELTQENVTLEHELNDLRSRSTNELSNLRESKQSFDMLKSNYYEIKNQYELMSMKYQSMADENFNIRRDLLLYEKEIKIKNETIERLRREIIESNKKNLLGEMSSNSGSNLNLNLNLNNILKGAGGASKYDDYETNDREWEREPTDRERDFSNVKNKRAERGEKERDNQNSFNKIKKSVSKKDLYEQHLEEFNKTGGFKGPTYSAQQNKDFSSNNYFSSSSTTSGSDKENKIKFLENKMSGLNREREAVQAELNKMPQHPKKRDQIAKKQELEDKVENYGRELAQLKVELKELTSIKDR
jgi:hypothetical protein